MQLLRWRTLEKRWMCTFRMEGERQVLLPYPRKEEKVPLSNQVQFKFRKRGKLVIEKGDLSRWYFDCRHDAIVAPANNSITPGLGVNRAIHKAAGKGIECMVSYLPEISPGIKCAVGDVLMTQAYKLKVRRIIHAVGPPYDGRPETPALLQRAYRKALEIAADRKLKYVAFPAISCGVYGYPADEGAEIALKAVNMYAAPWQEVHFVLDQDRYYQVWLREAHKQFIQAT